VKLSLSTGTLYLYPLRTVMRWARETGFDGVELNINPEAIVRGGRALRNMAEEEGTRILTVHPCLMPIPGWQEPHGGLAHTIALAQGAGASLVVLHVPHSESMGEGQGRAFRARIEEWMPRLAGSGLRLAVENKAIRNEAELRYALAPLHKLRAFADQYDLPLVLDTCHAGSAGEDLLGALRLFDGRLANVHLSDMGRPLPVPLPSVRRSLQEHRFPGAGLLPLEAFLQRLGSSTFAGPLTLEVNPAAMRFWWPPAARRRLVRAARWMRDVANGERQASDANRET